MLLGRSHHLDLGWKDQSRRKATMTRQRHRPGRRLSLEVGFEPRRGGQEALTQAYERLLLALSRPVSLIPTRRSKEAHDAISDDTPDPTAPAAPSGTGGHLRARLL
jgi:hypothetical protein